MIKGRNILKQKLQIQMETHEENILKKMILEILSEYEYQIK